MKRTNYKSYLVLSFMALAVIGGMTACSEESGFFDYRANAGTEGLGILPTVSESAQVVTRAESIVELMEKQLNTLDVFVEPVTAAGTFLRQYHLTEPTEADLNLLAERWRNEGLEMGKNYNIYVATNNPLTTSNLDNVEALKALVYDEVTADVAVIDDDNNIGWGTDATSGNIYKLYDAAATNSDRALTAQKEFMMDGVIKNWTPDPTTVDQVFDVTLNRAAAKIVLNVNFSADFLMSLTHDKTGTGTDTTWTPKPPAEQMAITGSPAWRFSNFAFGAPVIAPDTQGDGVEVHNSGFNIFHNQTFEGDDKHFQIITYTYPNKWEQANYATDAPSLVISVPYTQGTVTTYNYYRVPIVMKDTTAIRRNHIYVINATIATRGSELHEDEDVIEDVIYNVLPWNDETNSQAIHNEVQSVQHYYFNVNPKVYTLRGDGDQSVVLNYTKASGTKVNWKLFTYDAEGNQTGIVDNTSSAGIRAWFYNSNGAFTTVYNDNSGTDWSHMGVDIVQSTEGTSGSTGTVTVTSTALNNKAIKYIRLRVYLDEPATFQNGVETMYEDIIIRHFPTDNIQNVAGSWSSYHSSSNSTTPVTLTTRTLSEAESWSEQYGIDYTTTERTVTENITYATWAAHSSEEGYNIVGPTEINAFPGNLNNNQIRNANSQENAVLYNSVYYWGEEPQQIQYSYGVDYDYYVAQGYNNYQLYRYAHRYSAQYTHTYTYNEYSITVPMADTGDWVDWDAADKANHSDRRNYTVTYGNDAGTFNAKVMVGTTMYEIEENQHGTWNNRYYSTDQGEQETLTNNHMYVIQISSTSDQYVLGRPYVNTNTHQSQDNVVSPAFMIASQLGAVLPFTGNNGPANAAEHCSRYMEVAADGTRYTGWRLPTEAEISVITGYQYGNIGGVTIPNAFRVLVPVLTGQWYHSLSGQEVEANPNAGQGSTTRSYLRCVRDLSAAEVERLNGFDKIQEKYSNQ